MLIVIEGCDLTGKSTLAARLAEMVDDSVVHHAGPCREHPLVEYEMPLADYDPNDAHAEIPEHPILDRWHLGEQVWPQIFKRETKLDVAVARHLELFMRSRGAWYVYAERSAPRLQEAIRNADPPEPITPAQVPLVLDLFERAVQFAGRPCSSWNFERDGETVMEGIISNAFAMAEGVWPVWDIIGHSWIGSPAPRVILVGDTPAPVQKHTASIPGAVFAPFTATSGHYLFEWIPEWWRDALLVNAWHGERRTKLFDLWFATGMPSVIALGQKAVEACEQEGVPFNPVPHPQWWRRFNYHDGPGYYNLLKEAACL